MPSGYNIMSNYVMTRIKNNNNDKKWRRRRRLLPLSVMFCWTQKSLLAVGAALCLLLVCTGTPRCWRRGDSQQQQQSRIPNIRSASINMNKKKKKDHHHPFVDSSFHFSNSNMRSKTREQQPAATTIRIKERLSATTLQQQPEKTTSKEAKSTTEGEARIKRSLPPSHPLSSVGKTLQQPATIPIETEKQAAAEGDVISITITTSNNNNDACLGKERLVQILIDAGMSRVNATQTCPDLPTWDTIVNLYGAQPVIIQHHCQRQQQKSNPLQPRVAGLYNTGTNALVKLLPLNLPKSMWAVVPEDEDDADHVDNNDRNTTTSTTNGQLQQNKKKTKKKTTYFDWDVPWGKHNPPNTFYNQKGLYMPGQANLSIADILPVVVVKDPYWWMQSMCHNRYGVQWKKQQQTQQQQEHCPYLIMEEETTMSSSLSETTTMQQQQPQKPVPISVHRTVRRKEYVQDYDSLLHLWTDFYSQYLVATMIQHEDNNKNVDISSASPKMTTVVDFPFVMVRFEDLLFHAPVVLQAIANCANGYNNGDSTTTSQNNVKSKNTKNRPFSYYLPKSKSHGKTSTDFVSAMIKYGTTRGRTNGMMLTDLQFAQYHLQQTQLSSSLSQTRQLTDNNGSSNSSNSLMQILHYQMATTFIDDNEQ